MLKTGFEPGSFRLVEVTELPAVLQPHTKTITFVLNSVPVIFSICIEDQLKKGIETLHNFLLASLPVFDHSLFTKIKAKNIPNKNLCLVCRNAVEFTANRRVAIKSKYNQNKLYKNVSDRQKIYCFAYDLVVLRSKQMYRYIFLEDLILRQLIQVLLALIS